MKGVKYTKVQIWGMLAIVCMWSVGCGKDRRKISSNELSAMATLRTIDTAQSLYKSSELPNEYGELSDLERARVVDSVVGAGRKSGYIFTCKTWAEQGQPRYSVIAVPAQPGVSGERSFYIDDEGVIRVEVSGDMPSEKSPTVD